MPSILPDYEYDIFISYRQNDNQPTHSSGRQVSVGWVTSFVEALRVELEATLKNPVSIYFDENPHDGLLETHQVDASLAKKLKCLVFIPIVSQTYCDESSFAWKHEFLPFLNMAKEDELGMNITLSNGNVVSRILPIKIHDLDTEDQHTLEAVMDGPLRSIDFIYREPGVNSPLKPSDDRNLNLEKTDYQYQVNKVANALKDIGTSVLKQGDVKISVPETKTETPGERKPSTKGLFIAIASIVVAVLLYWGYSQFFSSPVVEDEDVTIAVLAFDDQSPNGDQEWLGDGMADEILNVLARVNGLQVTGKTSSFSFKGEGATINEIGKALNVKTVLEGSVSKVGNKLRITAQLIDVETDKHIWSNKYDRDASDILAIIDEVAQSIAGSLKRELSVADLKELKLSSEVDPEAYAYFLKGEYLLYDKFMHERKNRSFVQSEKMFAKAISIDHNFSNAYAGLAILYFFKGDLIKRDSITNLANKLNLNSAYLTMTKGLRFTVADNYLPDSAFHYYWQAHLLEPNNLILYNPILDHLTTIGLNNIAITVCNNLLIKDPLNALILFYRAIAFDNLGKHEIATEQVKKLLEIYPLHPWANGYMVENAILYETNLNEARSIYKILENLETSLDFSNEKSLILAFEGKKDEAMNIAKDTVFVFVDLLSIYSVLDMKKEGVNRVDSMSALMKYAGYWEYDRLKNHKSATFIREDSKFKEILAKAKKIHDQRVAKYEYLFDE